jgi:hypothetical protein
MDGNPSGAVSRLGKAWGGVVFAVLFVIGVVLASQSPSDTDKVKNSPTELTKMWHDFYSDSGHRWSIIIGFFLVVAAAIALVVFASELRERLVAAGASGAGRLAFAGSLLFAALSMAGTAAMAWIPGAKQFGRSAVPEGELNYLASQLGFGTLLVGGGASAALLLVTAGRGAVRTRLLPSWLGWAGVVIGVVLFFLSVLFIPMVLLALWVLAAAIVMIRKPASA